jgi:hypothetical protein
MKRSTNETPLSTKASVASRCSWEKEEDELLSELAILYKAKKWKVLL